MKWKAMVAQLANRINQPHVIDSSMRRVYAAGLRDGKRRIDEPGVTENIKLEMHGWVARDENGLLQLFTRKPDRCHIFGGGWITEDDSQEVRLPETAFPFLRWEDEPMECTLVIESINLSLTK